MPIDALRGNRDFRHEIVARHRHTFAGRATQSDAPYHSILSRKLLLAQELTELFRFFIGRSCRRQSYAKAELARALNACACSRPRARAAMQIVPLRRRTI